MTPMSSQQYTRSADIVTNVWNNEYKAVQNWISEKTPEMINSLYIYNESNNKDTLLNIAAIKGNINCCEAIIRVSSYNLA